VTDPFKHAPYHSNAKNKKPSKMLRKFVHNFVSYPVDGTNNGKNSHDLRGGGKMCKKGKIYAVVKVVL